MKVRTREGRLDSFQITLYLLLKCKNNYFPALSLTGLEILLYEYLLFFFFFISGLHIFLAFFPVMFYIHHSHFNPIENNDHLLCTQISS